MDFKRAKAADKAAEATPVAPAPQAAVEVAIPANPVPLAIGTMMVGAANDRAEVEADRLADSALARLTTATAPVAHQHGADCDHARRLPMPALSGAVVGFEGGELDANTTATIDARRGSGHRLETDVLRRMQTAFSSDFSSVRVHNDETSAHLNRTMSARAFTTGNDIFFGKGQYAPRTPEGERVLAHELAHTLQSPNAAPIGRLVPNSGPVIRRNWFTDLFKSCFPFFFSPDATEEERAPLNPRERADTISPPSSSTPSGPVVGPTTGPVTGSPQTSSPQTSSSQTSSVQTSPAQASPVQTSPVQQQAMTEHEAKALAELPDGPTPLAALCKLNDAAIQKLVPSTENEALKAWVHWNGPMMDILKGSFEADWVKAKECLVFWKWPSPAVPSFSPDNGLRLMKALTALRGKVHEELQPKVLAAMKGALGGEKAKHQPGSPMHKSLTAGESLQGNAQVEYKGSVGADSVTSDVDVSTGGANSEIAVRVYNEEFRNLIGLAVDPGTVFDLNVYAMDFIHGRTVTEGPNKTKSLAPKGEHDIEPTAQGTATRDEEQDIWSLVHVARYMPNDADWNKYVGDTLEKITDPAKKDVQKQLLVKARERAVRFEEQVQETMKKLAKTVDESLNTMGQSSWADNKHYKEAAVRMRAANNLYEEHLLQVKQIRAEIEDLKQTKANPERLQFLVADLSRALSQAQLFANEVYGSGGATVHAVVGVQLRNKERVGGFTVNVQLTPAQWQQAFTDNLGDVLKDYEHYGHAHTGGGPNYPYAAFKMGKYVDRMLDTVVHLGQADGGPLGDTDLAKLKKSEEFVKLTELANYHVEEKGGAAGADPKTLSTHKYFGAITDAGKLKQVRDWAVSLGVTVRALIGNGPPAQPGPTKPDSGSSSDSAQTGTKVVDSLKKMSDSTQQTQSVLAGVASAADPTK